MTRISRIYADLADRIVFNYDLSQRRAQLESQSGAALTIDADPRI